MKRPMFLTAAAFVLGEVLGLRISYALIMLTASVIISAVILFLPVRDRDGPADKSKRGRLKVFLIFFVLLGFFRGNAERAVCGFEAGLGLDGVKTQVSGKVRRIRESEERIEVLISPEDESLRYLLLYIDGGNLKTGTTLSLGIKILVRGRYSQFTEAADPGQFDYSGYYRAQKLTYRFFADELEVTDDKTSIYYSCRESMRRFSLRLSALLDKAADPDDAGILRSLLLGDKSGLDGNVRDLYQKSGIAHLLAISGLHLSLISAAVYGLLRRTGLGFGLSGFLGGTALLCYCLMSGASVSSMRALIMILLSYTAAWKGRSYDLCSSLGLAAFLLFFDSPYQLTQSGPLLSFLAVLGIAAITEMKGRADNEISAKGGKERRERIRDTLGTSLGIQLITAPVILWNFFRFPLYGILINLFVLPLMGCVIASGAAGLMMGMISLTLGRFFLGLSHYILLFYDLLCRIFMALPASSLLLGRPDPVRTGIYYGLLICLYIRGKKLFKLLPLFILLIPLPVIGCSIIFMDVGQGDGILIRSPAATVLVDGGSSSVGDLYKERLLPCLESLAVSRIDYAYVSHCDSDHTSGLYMLLGKESPVKVKNLVLPAAGRGNESYDVLIERARESGTKAFWMRSGDVKENGRMKITCLYPDDSGGYPDPEPNEHSLVLCLDYGDFSMLLTGDMSRKGESAILEDPGLCGDLSRIDVLKVAHHGSASAGSDPWLDMLGPRWAVISCGVNNRYRHPAPETVEALKERDITIYSTMNDGAILLWTNGRKIRWSAFKARGRPSPL